MTRNRNYRGVVNVLQQITVDLLVVGSGTGMAAALAASELGLSSLIVEKTAYVGGSTARSGGAFWMPANPVLLESGSSDSIEQARFSEPPPQLDLAGASRWMNRQRDSVAKRLHFVRALRRDWSLNRSVARDLSTAL